MIHSLNAYYIFYIAAQCGNISGAARKLYISQPAVSKAIAKLEEGFHTQLLLRKSRGVTLTEEGELLYQQLHTAFHAIHTGEKQLQEKEILGIGHISIGVSATLCKYLLLPYLQHFLQENPHVKISISCQSTYQTLQSLENGSLDIGLVGETKRLGSLKFLPMKTVHDIFVGSKNYLKQLALPETNQPVNSSIQQPYLETGAKEDMQFSKATLLLLDRNNITRQYIDQYLLSQNLSGEQFIEVTTMDLLIDFAKIDLGLACVIREFVETELKEGSLIEFPIKEPIPSRRIGFAYAQGTSTNKALNRFLTMVSNELLLDHSP